MIEFLRAALTAGLYALAVVIVWGVALVALLCVWAMAVVVIREPRKALSSPAEVARIPMKAVKRDLIPAPCPVFDCPLPDRHPGPHGRRPPS